MPSFLEVLAYFDFGFAFALLLDLVFDRRGLDALFRGLDALLRGLEAFLRGLDAFRRGLDALLRALFGI